MTISTTIADGHGTLNKVKVSSRGEMAVGPIEYSGVYNAEASVINTAYNLTVPKAGKRFVLTDVLIYANKSVGAGDATVVLYEALGPSNTTVDRAILNLEMVKQSSRDLTGLKLICSEGRWINIKTNDNTVFATIMGYYVTA